jgi:prepilin peptidase CpaA
VILKVAVVSYMLVYIVIASYWDCKYNKIPNWLNFSSIILGVSLNAYFLGWVGLKSSLWGFSLGIILFFIPFALGGVGAGDVKFLAGIGALTGPDFTLWVFLISSLLYFLVAIVILVQRKNLFSFIKKLYVLVVAKTNTLDTIYDEDRKGKNIPLGVFISLSVLITDIFIFHLGKEVWNYVVK